MRSRRQGSIPSDIGDLIDELDDLGERVRALEAPTGEALSSTVAKLQGLVANITETLNNYMAGRRTDAQIDAAIDAKIAAAIAAAFAGNVSITGSLTVNGALAAASLSTGGSLTAGGTVTLTGARGTSLVSAPNRVNAWLAGDGRLGHTA
ncbi:hypothetical protein [Microbacterium sp. SMR1]|uniref:hypothetical protein n=1 Tax=Microbacterium sp. SMR1 TaxID=1497340 RepID=UPI000DCED125|nr:hypothetical protein [Microbacterium sp. SMR1]RAZ34821.1 hypothetical protein DO944_03085 [Microbacterium sp. SMR1]